MKTIITSILILSTILTIAQPIIPTFKQAKPIWSNLLINPYNIDFPDKNDRGPYTSFLSNNSVIRDSFQYSFTMTITDTAVTDGFIFQKVNYRTGQILWQDHVNVANQSAGHLAPPSTINFRSDGTIELLGNRKVERLYLNNFDMSYRRVYNDLTGQIISMQYDATNQAKYLKSGVSAGDYVVIKPDSLYLQINTETYGWTDAKVAFLFNVVNADQNNISEVARINYEPYHPVNIFSYRRAFGKVLNDSIYVGFVKVRSPDISKYPNTTELIFINYKDTSNIRITRKVNISDQAIYDPRPPEEIFMDIIDGKIVLINSWYDYEKGFPHTYHLTLNDKGETINYIKSLTVDNQRYSYIRALRITDTVSYYFAWPSKLTDKPTYTRDIISVDANNNGKYIASISTTNDDLTNSVFPFFATLTPDDYFLLVGSYDVTINNDQQNSSTNLYGFLLEDLIKGSLVSTEHTYHYTDEIPISVFPNPTNNAISINLNPNLKSEVTDIIVMDIMGRKILTSKLNSDLNTNQIDVSNFSPGVYFIHVSTKDTNKQFSPIKMIKL